MIKEDLRACAKELVGFHERFAPCFGRVECQGHAFHYLQGLLLAPDRKSVEPMALQFAEGNVIPMQRFLTRGCWDAVDVQREVQAVAAQRLAPSAGGGAVGPVLVIDESGEAALSPLCGRLHQEGHTQCRRGPTTQRATGKGRQLPGGCLSDLRHTRRQCSSGSPALSAQGMGRRPEAPGRNPHSRPGGLSHQAAVGR